ncbi:MAG: MarR family winged helix-turn-helix transcriptional regulator [Paracholeplasma sp.]|jgi:DNA-binding MarR family transcriptional regulator|uniref:Transcriptional regulator, MarR family n=1 Tax=Acholeplasma brassicae TaxID=61635 RepID=U4KN71_9MOLU|nr:MULTISPECIES: MarR family winged helix-turn-helix transcriptional regulator [Paracholeplasma]MDY3195725.1 MarR family winged helix-turn-helix transcriptional regulator [Paracholeplasma sp.]CCV65695.1 Transcriptional regulator, MarR family [Paracholeplasma brassicae]
MSEKHIDYDYLSLTQELHSLTKMIHQSLDDQIKDFNISRLHAPYIKLLSVFKTGLTQKELTSKLGVDKANTSRAINDLVKKNYVKKDFQENLEINYKLVLTEKGLALSNTLMKTVEDKYVELFSVLELEELETFRRIVKKITSSAIIK